MRTQLRARLAFAAAATICLVGMWHLPLNLCHNPLSNIENSLWAQFANLHSGVFSGILALMWLLPHIAYRGVLAMRKAKAKKLKQTTKCAVDKRMHTLANTVLYMDMIEKSSTAMRFALMRRVQERVTIFFVDCFHLKRLVSSLS